ncbi:unnamed protein product [marine sediment metagenome]|uniref:Uncharacterized protein n=1 Tax=marine sediment metagenome TaxID=412755 RepID=X1BWP4_9ZZZZ
MNDKEIKLSVESLYKNFLKSIESGNHENTSTCLSLIPIVESNFLRIYQNRKKEGAFYTRDSIANFIITKGLILFFDNYLDNCKINHLDDIYGLNKDEKEMVTSKLKNLTYPCLSKKLFGTRYDIIPFDQSRDFNKKAQ